MAGKMQYGLALRGQFGKDEDISRCLEELLEQARLAETLGWDSITKTSHYSTWPRQSFQLFPILARLTAETSRVRINAGVVLLSLHKPLDIAEQLATIDIMSGGRLIFGAALGYRDVEFKAFGTNQKERVQRFEENLTAIKRLWTEDHVTFDGKHFALDDVTLDPKPVQPGGVPVLLATHYRTGSERQALRAARYGDGIIGISDYPDDFAATVAKVNDFAVSEGRDLTNFEHVYYMTVHVDDDRAKATEEAEDFLVSYYGVNHWGDRWGPWGTPDEIVAKMQAFAAAGADHLVVRFAAWDQLAQWERFRADVLPAFRGSTG